MLAMSMIQIVFADVDMLLKVLQKVVSLAMLVSSKKASGSMPSVEALTQYWGLIAGIWKHASINRS